MTTEPRPCADAPPASLPSPPSRDVDDDARTWAGARALMRGDFARMVDHMEPGGASLGHRVYFFLLPGLQALLWYRVARCAYLRGWTKLARFVSLFALYVTRAEIPPTTSIGASALIAHATGVSLFGRIGARFTVQGHTGVGGGFGVEDIGAGPGYPVIGDDVVLAFGASVLGPWRVGRGVHIGPGALVTSDVPDHSLVMWPKPRIIVGAAAPSAVR